MTQWVQKLWLSCLVVLLLTKTCASISQFVASIEIDADFADADYDLQSQRMTDLNEELRTLFGHLEGFLELELESVRPANCNLVARVIVTVTSKVSVDDMDNLLETLQCAPVTIGGETYSVYDAVRSTRDLEVCVIGGEQQLLTFDGWRGYVPTTPCPYIAGLFISDANPECSVAVFAGNSDETIEGRYFPKAVAVIPYSPKVSIYHTDDEAISNAGPDPLAEVWIERTGTARPDVLTAFDPVSRTALLTMPSCNITVAFTSTNVSLDQPLARYPELSILVPPDLIDEKSVFPKAMCSAPPEVLTNDYPPDLLSIYGVMLQPYPGFPVFPQHCCNVACFKAAELTQHSCGEDPLASIVTCGPILAKPSLVSCLPAPIMDTFNVCLRYVCQNDVDACHQLRTLADGSCPELATNLTLNC